MYAYLTGTLSHSDPHYVVIDVGGIGFEVFISIAAFEKLPQLGSEVKMYTAFIVREDSQKLYGFLAREEKELFYLLCDISGVGPRIAMSILGHLSFESLHSAVEHGDVKSISKVPGVGKKMAERLILELKGKSLFTNSDAISLSPSKGGPIGDAINALINLGYCAADAQKAVKNVALQSENEIPLPELISLALKAKKG